MSLNNKFYFILLLNYGYISYRNILQATLILSAFSDIFMLDKHGYNMDTSRKMDNIKFINESFNQYLNCIKSQ